MLFLSFGLFICYVAALLICAGNLISLYNHISSTTRAFFCNWSAPAHKITLRVVNTAIVFSSLPCFLKHNILPAVLALNAGVILFLVVLTLVSGRIYCSVICPLGIFQDIVARIGRRKKKNALLLFQT